MRPLISKLPYVQEHLFQGPSLLPRFKRLCAEPGRESGSEVVVRARRTPCWIRGGADTGSDVAANCVAGNVEPTGNFPDRDAVSDVPASNNSK